MKPYLRRLYHATLVGLTCCALLPPANAGSIPHSVARLLDKYGIPASAISLDVRDADSGESILAVNSHQPRIPASAIKILTTLSALEILGPHHQWQTRYLADGKIENGVLKGNLVMQGGGNPFLTVERFWHHLLLLRQRGVHTITGDLIIDDSYFDIQQPDQDTPARQPGRPYNVHPDAALVNFSVVHFTLYPRRNQVTVSTDPPLAGVVIDNRIKAKSGKCTNSAAGWSINGIKRQGDSVTVRFDGNYRTKCGEYLISRSIMPSHEYTFRLFKYLWTDSNGRFAGDYRVSATPAGATEILDYPSLPLADMITGINKYSNNVMSRQLFLSIDAQRDVRPGTLEGSRQRIQQWLSANSISMPELFVDNGSGLSRDSRVTTAGLAQLLQHGWNSNYRAEFLSSFALSSLDGTMRKRLPEAGLDGRFRIKTGWLRGVRSMAGYANSRHDRRYTVAMIIQSDKVSYSGGNRIQDALLKWIYNL